MVGISGDAKQPEKLSPLGLPRQTVVGTLVVAPPLNLHGITPKGRPAALASSTSRLGCI